VAVPGTLPFTEEEVKQMNTDDLRAAFHLRFGRESGSGNMPYLRRKLQAVYGTDAQRAPSPARSGSSSE
jgi:hypothetical protein